MSKDVSDDRKRRTMYVAVPREVHVAARQRALAEGKTLSEVVEEALRGHLGMTDGGDDDCR